MNMCFIFHVEINNQTYIFAVNSCFYNIAEGLLDKLIKSRFTDECLYRVKTFYTGESLGFPKSSEDY